MQQKLQQIRKAIQYKNSENLGDFAILKADILGAKVNPAIADQLAPLAGYHPLINLDELSQYPVGSFGREYADHMRTNQLKPFNVSPELEDVAQRNVFALRYVVTHDIFHVLLGFDTSYAGEIGVLAFAVAQNYSPAQKIGLGLAKFLYPIWAREQTDEIFANIQRGKLLGQQAKLLLSYRFEEYWHEPIHELRARLGLPEVLGKRRVA